jgi:hypothetical protein
VKRSLVVLAFLLAPSVHAGDRAKSYALWCSAKAGDLVTTELSLSRGGVEQNPLMKNRAVRISAGVGVCVVAAEVDHKLQKHTKTRWVVRALGVGLMAYAIQKNARVGK